MPLRSPWDDESRFDLISLIQERRLLWRGSDPSFRNWARKTAAWNEITHLLSNASPNENYTARDVQAQWKNLKDTYVRLNRKARESGANGRCATPPWRFMTAMRFLDDASASTSAKIEEPDEDDEEGEEDVPPISSSSRSPRNRPAIMSQPSANKRMCLGEAVNASSMSSSVFESAIVSAITVENVNNSRMGDRRSSTPTTSTSATATPIPARRTQISTDECTNFGAVVGDKLRQLKAVDQILYLRTQKLINDLIYEAELEAAERHIY